MLARSAPRCRVSGCKLEPCSTEDPELTGQYGHSSVVDPIGNVIVEADEKEAIVYADIGGYCYSRVAEELTIRHRDARHDAPEPPGDDPAAVRCVQGCCINVQVRCVLLLLLLLLRGRGRPCACVFQ